MTGRPTDDELRDYRDGALAPEAFERVDAWLATQPEAEQERLLAGVEEDRRLAEEEPRPVFTGAGGQARYRQGQFLGDGGMGTVRELKDTVLGRRVALKSCRARREGEPLAGHDSLERLFRHEATILAGLEHPSIVAVHDAGLDGAGSPAFVMERLDGVPLDAWLGQHPVPATRRDLAPRVRLVTRVAEALAYAHGRGVVHRDLKPENVVVDAQGNPTLIDWGLAAAIGAADAVAAGTPGWMAPEQFAGAAPDPRQDVFSLGGLVQYVLTGAEPRRGPPAEGEDCVHPHPAVPAGLAAVVRRCLVGDPARRYADAAEVLAELDRWLAEGITRAQRPSPTARLKAFVRRRPAVATAGFFALAVAAGIAGWSWWSYHREADAIRRQVRLIMENTRYEDATSLDRSIAQLEDLRRSRPLPEIGHALDRLETAGQVLISQMLWERRRRQLRDLDRRYDREGTWATETADRLATLAAMGFLLEPDTVEDEAARLGDHPLKDRIIPALIALQRAAFLAGSPEADRLARVVPALIGQAGDAAQMATSRLYAASRIGTHQLEFGPGAEDDLAAVLDRPELADLLLQSHRPDERLRAYVDRRLADDPAAFWPRLVAARLALAADRPAAARRHALVAFGARADSLWPRLLLAYAAMELGDDGDLLAEAQAGLVASPRNLQLKVLLAVGLARTGRLAEAQRLIDDTGAWAHYRYHLERPAGHPMDRSVKAMVEAGVVVPSGKAELGSEVE